MKMSKAKLRDETWMYMEKWIQNLLNHLILRILSKALWNMFLSDSSVN